MNKLKKILLVLLTVMMVLTNIPSAYAEESDGDSSDTSTTQVASDPIHLAGDSDDVYNFSFDVSLEYETIKWDGSEKEPEVTIVMNAQAYDTDGEDYEEDLTKNEDYTIVYSNNINVTSDDSLATVTITGTGSYTGTITKTFEITENSIDVSASSITPTTATINFDKIEVADNVNVTYDLTINGKTYENVSDSKTIDGLDAGNEYTATITAKDSSENVVGSGSTTFTTKKTTSITTSYITASTAKFSFASISNDDISSYSVVVKDSSGGEFKSYSSATAGTTYSLSDLSANKTYTIDVTAKTSDGTSYNVATKSFTTKKVTSITTSSVYTTSAKFKFTAISGDGITSYKAVVKDSSGNTIKTFSNASGGTTYSLTGLSVNKTYTITVTATNSETSYTVATKSFTTKKTTSITTPAITTTTAKYKFASISGNSITGYKVVVKNSNGTTVKTVTSASSNTTYSLSGLTKNTKYTITVSATTDGSNYYQVASSSFTTKNTTSITTSAITTTTAKYKFASISNNSIKSYKVVVKDSNGNTVKTVSSASGNTTYSLSGLTANKTYTITVTATTSDATYTVATKSFTTKKTTTITTSAITTTTAKYKFSTISNNGITSYKIILKDSSGNTVKTVNPAKSNTTLSFSGLTANKKYTITVQATTSDATYTVATKSFTTKKTTSITTSSITSSSAKYKFTSITDNGIKSYKVVVKNASGNTIKTVNSAKGNTTYSLSGLSQNTKYTITVTATTSDATYTVATKTFTTLPTVGKVTASTKAGNEMALVSWKKISGASGYQVYRSTSKNGTYTKVKTITSGSTTSYTNYLLTSNKTYYYKVRAYKTVNGTKVYGSFSAIKSVKTKAATSSTYYLRVNIKTNCTVAYAKNFSGKWVAVKAFATSAGANGASKAIIGTHYTIAKYRWKYMHENCYTQYATRIVGHYLFYSVPYSKAKPNTLWTNSYNKLGSHASAGCIRMDVISSKWIYDHCPLKTKVVVTYSSSDALTKPTPKKISSSVTGAKRTWDPTDPDSSNPWNK